MVQISNKIFCDEFVIGLNLENKITASYYADYPYLIIKDFLAPETIASIVDFVKLSNDIEVAAIKKVKKRSVVVPKVDSQIRKTLIYKLPDIEQNLYDNAFLRHQSLIEEFFAIAITTATKVQVLQYIKDYFYIKHADDSSEIINENKETIGFKVVAPNRKLTTVLFGTTFDESQGDNEHFTGGELVFNYLFDANANRVIIKPEAGDMIVFPSNPIYSHEVLPVRSGNRITLVQWHNALIS